jgi:hypothetical protein
MRKVIDKCKAYLIEHGAISPASICFKHRVTYQKALEIEKIVRKELELETASLEREPL